jgi:hypothetical protein
MSRFISFSEYAPPSTSLLILACIATLGANSGVNQLPPKAWDKRPHLSSLDETSSVCLNSLPGEVV